MTMYSRATLAGACDAEQKKHLRPEIVVRLLESVNLAQERFPRQVAHWAGGAGKSNVVTVLRPRLTHVLREKLKNSFTST